ncbi:MAG: siderophore-interacting protein [Paracoccaceae bacterium]
MTPTLAHAAETEVAVKDAAKCAGAVAHHLQGHGAAVQVTPGRWRVDFGLRRAELSLAGKGLLLRAEGADASLAHEMRLDLAEHLAEFGGPARILWPGVEERATPPNFRLMTVACVTDLTPHMRRIRLTGTELLRFDTMAALHCKLLLPPAGQPVSWPSLDDRGRFRHGNGIVRKYTVRRLDVAAGWMDIDFVLHDDAGPGSAFAAAARPGDPLGLIGPGGGGVPLTGPMLLAGDETALPAIARALEALPEGADAQVLVEVADAAEEQPLSLPPRSSLRWLHRNGAVPGTLLAHAVAEAAPGPETEVWVACEFAAFRAIRNDLRGRLAHPRARHLVTSYWRAGVAEGAGLAARLLRRG